MLLPKEKLVCKHRDLIAVELHPLLLDEDRNFGFVSAHGAEVMMMLTVNLTRGHVQSHHAHVAGHVDVLLCVRVRARVCVIEYACSRTPTFILCVCVYAHVLIGCGFRIAQHLARQKRKRKDTCRFTCRFSSSTIFSERRSFGSWKPTTCLSRTAVCSRSSTMPCAWRPSPWPWHHPMRLSIINHLPYLYARA